MAELVPDVWLASQLDRPCFRLDAADGERSPAAALGTLPEGPAFVYARVSCGDTAGALQLQRAGLRIVDVNLTFTRHSSGNASVATEETREAAPGDREQVVEVAGRSFTCTRFHLDPAIGEGAGRAIKRAWAGNFFNGSRGDRLLVSEKGGRVAGFLLAICRPGRCIIDLIAVDPDFQGHGIGAALIARCAALCPPEGLISAGTQAANQASIGFYQKCGFRLTSCDYVLHWHK